MKDLTHLQNDADFQQKLVAFSKKHFHPKMRKLVARYRVSLSNSAIKFPEDSDFNSVWSELKEMFIEKQGAQCSICEKEIKDIYSQDIEHYRPKNQYWWLAYNPKNYYFICAECNRSYKHTHFPLINGQTTVPYYDRKNMEKLETPLLLNPMSDKVNEYFELVFIIHPQTNKGIAILAPLPNLDAIRREKALKTIEIFNLDLHKYTSKTDNSRFNLLHEHYNDLIDIAKMRLECADINTFKGFIKQKLQERPKLKQLGLLKLILNKQFKINNLVL